MDKDTHYAVMIDEYGGQTHMRSVPKPQPKEGELLVKMDASTINPSDLIFLQGGYFQRPLPAVCGLEGTGHVVAANGAEVQSWVGKRVTFFSGYGTWCEFSTCHPSFCFEITADVPEQSAASGLINPLTAIGFIEHYKKAGCKGGIVHTAAASGIGKMLNRLCISNGINLLGVVRKQEQADIMLKEGITDVVITNGDWAPKFKEVVEKKGYDCLFDALGGGPVTDTIISNMPTTSSFQIYGLLEGKPFTLSNTYLFFQGVQVTGFFITIWWGAASADVQKRVRENYSEYLKKDLSSTTALSICFNEIEKGLKHAKENPTNGKVLIRMHK